MIAKFYNMQIALHSKQRETHDQITVHDPRRKVCSNNGCFGYGMKIARFFSNYVTCVIINLIHVVYVHIKSEISMRQNGC